jgi:bifunctional DNase/RNase
MKKILMDIRDRLIKFLLKDQNTSIKKIKLDILGISYTKSGDQTLYIVILGEEGEKQRKVPVVINYFEAQAIAIEVEKILPIVPLVYDVLEKIIIEHNARFDEILISDFKNDILFTYLIGKKEKIELRTADALAISVRMDYPIYIYENVLDKVDEIVKKYYDIKKGSQIGTQVVADKDRLHGFTLKELNDLLQKAIDEEEYEKASEIRDEIIKKKKKDTDPQ